MSKLKEKVVVELSPTSPKIYYVYRKVGEDTEILGKIEKVHSSCWIAKVYRKGFYTTVWVKTPHTGRRRHHRYLQDARATIAANHGL
jgi:hypothetical protein